MSKKLILNSCIRCSYKDLYGMGRCMHSSLGKRLSYYDVNISVPEWCPLPDEIEIENYIFATKGTPETSITLNTHNYIYWGNNKSNIFSSIEEAIVYIKKEGYTVYEAPLIDVYMMKFDNIKEVYAV